MARPAEFDRNEVLSKAMNVFWRTGYTATSISDLVNATHLQPGSLYGAFNSKRGIFLEVIDFYANRRIEYIRESLQRPGPAVDAITHCFLRLCRDIENDKIGKGCLMVNTMLELATEDNAIRMKITEHLKCIEHNFYSVLENSRLNGELKSDTDCDILAKMLMTSIWGLRVMSTTRPDPAIYSSIISLLLSSLNNSRH